MKTIILIVSAILVFNISYAFDTKSAAEIENSLLQIQQIQSLFTNKQNSELLKSIELDKEKLDSITHADGSSKVFKYNEQGHVLQYQYFKYDDWDEVIELEEQQIYRYDDNGNEIYSSYSRNDAFDGFIETERTESTFNADNRPLTIVDYEYSETEKKMEKGSRIEYSYGDEYRMSSYFWSSSKNEWVLNGYQLFDLDKEMQPTLVKSYVDNGDGEFIHTGTVHMTYNERGDLIETWTEFLSEETMEWVKGLHSYTEYNSSGDVVAELDSALWGDEMILFAETRNTYAAGNLIREDEYSSNWATGEFQLTMSTEYNYVNGVLVSEVLKSTDWTTDAMNEQSRYEFSIDSNYDTNGLILPESISENDYATDIFDASYYENGIIRSVEYFSKDWQTDEIVSNRVATYYYSSGSSVVDQSSDATLSELLIDNEQIDGFSPNQLDYTVELEPSITTVPTVTAHVNDAKAQYTIIPAESLPGVTKVSVMAEDGTTILEYSVSFVYGNKSDATLSDIQLDGKTIDEFKSTLYNYELILPIGTTTIPVISATSSSSKATIEITQADALPGAGYIKVTAEDKSTSAVYSVDFKLAKSSDASLSDLLVNGVSIENFNKDVHAYEFVLSSDETQIPEVTAVCSHEKAQKTIAQAEGLNGIALIFILAEDGLTMSEYTVQFSKETGIGFYKKEHLTTYPNPFSNYIVIDISQQEMQRIEILNLNGQVVYENNTIGSGTIRISTTSLKQGVYLIRMINKNGIVTQNKVVK